MAILSTVRPLGCAILCALLWISAYAAAAVGEYELKLAMTFNVARFTQWPLQPDTQPFVYCIAGPDPFDGAASALTAREVHGRRIEVMTLEYRELEGAGCNLVFAADCDAQCAADMAADFAGRPVLTIGDVPGFAAAGGVVELENRDNRIAFVINTQAYRSTGLIFSSQLLQLATLLEPDRTEASR